MRILYSYDCLTTVGGADRILAEKASWLADHGFEVAMTLSQQCGRPMRFAPSDKVKIVDLGVDFDEQYKYYRNLPRRGWIYLRCMWQFKRRFKAFVRQWKPDIIINTLGRDTGFLSRLGDGSIHIAETHLAKPYIRFLNQMEARGGIQKYVARYTRRQMEQATARLDCLVCLTQADAGMWSASPHVDSRKLRIEVIPDFLTMQPSRQADCQAKSCIAVGRMAEQKGYDYMVEAWETVAQRHPDWKLNIYGAYELAQEKVEKLIADKGLAGSITLHKPTNKIMECYPENSIMVLSSRFEGFGMVLQEAMQCGVPCVAFDCPCGPRDIIADGQDGILTPYLDTKALAEGICKLIENPELRKQMGRKAAENIRRYDKETIMRQWQQLFAELAKGRKGTKTI